jgi:hypothetical protein
MSTPLFEEVSYLIQFNHEPWKNLFLCQKNTQLESIFCGNTWTHSNDYWDCYAIPHDIRIYRRNSVKNAPFSNRDLFFYCLWDSNDYGAYHVYYTVVIEEN